MVSKFTIFTFAALAFVLLNLPQVCLAQAVKADYSFVNSRSSTVAGAPDLTDIGTSANTFVTATIDGTSRTVLQFPEGNGLRLAPTTGIVPNDVYTIVVLFEFDSIGSGPSYKRVLDFKNGTSDYGLYVFNSNLRFFDATGGSPTGSTALAPSTYYQLALTRDAAGTVAGYVNGVQQFTFNNTSQSAVIDTNNALRFFRDNESGGSTTEHSSGSVARIRLYDTALTATQVAALDRLSSPTAASVTIGGRVMVGKRGLRNALVTMTLVNGETRTAITSAFGYYHFDNVPAGETRIFSVSAKRYTFSQPTQVLNITEETNDINFYADNW